MKQQEIIEKVLREKLEGAEMEPPAAMFDRIAAQIDRPVVIAWYRRPTVVRAAAAFTLLAVSAGLLFNNWSAQENGLSTSPGLASYDSLQQDRVEGQLKSLKLAAANAFTEEQRTDVDKISSTVQPTNETTRLASVTTSKQQIEMPIENRIEGLTAMEIKSVSALRSTKMKFQNPKKVIAPSMNENFVSADETGILPTLTRSYSLLSDGGLFELAKERFDDFKTKEHYVSINLGSLEIGQSFQLSRPESNATTETK